MKRLVSFGGVGSAVVLLCLFVILLLSLLVLDARSGSNAPAQSKNSVAASAAEALDTCNCGRIQGANPYKMWLDVNNDIAIGPPDVVRMVKYVYQGQKTAIIAPPGVVYPNAPNDPPILPLTCQYKLGDGNKDGAVGPPDVVRYVKYVFQYTALLDNPCLAP